MLQNTYMYVSENAETEKSEGIQMFIYITFAEICKQPFIHRLIKEWPVRIERGVYTVYIYTYKREKSHNIPGISVSPHLQVDGDKLRHFTWGHWGANSSLGLNIVWQEGPLPDRNTWPKVGGLAARVLTFIAAVDLLLKLENLGCQLVIHVFEFLKVKMKKVLQNDKLHSPFINIYKFLSNSSPNISSNIIDFFSIVCGKWNDQHTWFSEVVFVSLSRWALCWSGVIRSEASYSSHCGETNKDNHNNVTDRISKAMNLQTNLNCLPLVLWYIHILLILHFQISEWVF